jgi:hypothetical protein
MPHKLGLHSSSSNHIKEAVEDATVKDALDVLRVVDAVQ